MAEGDLVAHDDDEEEDDDGRQQCPNPQNNPNCAGRFKLSPKYKGDPKGALCTACHNMRKDDKKKGDKGGEGMGGITGTVAGVAAAAMAKGGSTQDALSSIAARQAGGAFGRSSRFLPDRVIRPFNSSLGRGFLLVLPVGIAKAVQLLGAPPWFRDFATDFATDAAGEVLERLTGEPQKKEHKAEAEKAEKDNRAKLDELKSFSVALLLSDYDTIHWPRCKKVLERLGKIEEYDRQRQRGGEKKGGKPSPPPRVEHPGAILFLPFGEALKQGCKLPGEGKCCHYLLVDHQQQIDDLKKEIEEGTGVAVQPVKSFAELMNTPNGKKIGDYIDLYITDPAERRKTMKFLAVHLEEGELPYLGADNLEEPEFRLRLEMIENFAHAHPAVAQAKEAVRAFGEAVSVKPQLQAIGASVEQAGQEFEAGVNAFFKALGPNPPALPPAAPAAGTPPAAPPAAPPKKWWQRVGEVFYK